MRIVDFDVGLSSTKLYSIEKLYSMPARDVRWSVIYTAMLRWLAADQLLVQIWLLVVLSPYLFRSQLH